MSTLTPNYGFTKPDPTENALVDVLNTNMASIDTILKAREDEAKLLKNKEYGLDQSKADRISPNSLAVSSGAWGTIFLESSAHETPTTHWALNLRFAGRKTTGTAPTSLSIRVDRGVNRGGTLIVYGTNSSHVQTSQEIAVVSAITTVTGFHPPDESGQLAYWFDFRIVCAGETSNTDQIKIEVSPVGANASFNDVIAKLTMRS